jgi:glutamyl-tRNA reductase
MSEPELAAVFVGVGEADSYRSISVEDEVVASAVREAASFGEVAVFRTCRRSEIYLCAQDAPLAASRLTRALVAVGADPVAGEGRIETAFGIDAARHLFAVASGIRSPILGEGEILRQLREAWSGARTAGTTGVTLNRLFAQAVHVGKRVRTETAIGDGGASYPSAVVRSLEAENVELAGASVVVAGTGKLATSLALALARRGARITIASRTRERASALAARCGGAACDSAELAAVAAQSDVVVTASSSKTPLIGTAEIAEAMRGRLRPLVIVDLGFPANVERAVADVGACRLLDLDHVASVARSRESRRRFAVGAAEAIVEQEVAEFQRWRNCRAVVPELTLLRSRGRAVVERELRRDAACLARLSARDRRVVEALTHRVVNSLLHVPTVRLKEQAAGDGELVDYALAVRRLFAEDAA